MSNSNKSSKRLADGTYSTQTSSSNCSGSKTPIVYEYGESVEIKEEIIKYQERHHSGERNLLSEKNQLDENSISSGNKSGTKTSIVYEYDETLEIKEEIIHDQERHRGGEQNLLSKKNQLYEKSISSDNTSALKTSVVYEYDENLDIKEEINHERHQRGERNLLSEKNQLDEKSIFSVNKSAAKTSIVYEHDDTLEIKEEIIQDQETVTDQTLHEKYDLTLNTPDTREADILSTDKLRIHNKEKIQESKPDLGKKYKCRRCARSYKLKSSLTTHQKFECGVTPQFICVFCAKRFKKQNNMKRHVSQVHQKTNTNQKMQGTKQIPEKKYNIYSHINKRHQKINSCTSQAKHNCDKCPQSYSSLSGLKQHGRSKHAGVKSEFTCDICGYKANQKSNLPNHISSRHSKNSKISQAMHNCDKFRRSDSYLSGLKQHACSKHAEAKQFICDVCAYKTTRKDHLSSHISSRHFKNSKTSQEMHNCDNCFLSYVSLNALKRHNRLKHAVFKPQYICVFCNYKTYTKSHVSSHIASLHLKTSKTSQATHNCDKCFLSYTSLSGLYKHNRFKHAAVKPQQYICDFCSYKTYTKSHLSRHMSSLHFRKDIASEAQLR